MVERQADRKQVPAREPHYDCRTASVTEAHDDSCDLEPDALATVESAPTSVLRLGRIAPVSYGSKRAVDTEISTEPTRAGETIHSFNPD